MPTEPPDAQPLFDEPSQPAAPPLTRLAALMLDGLVVTAAQGTLTVLLDAAGFPPLLTSLLATALAVAYFSVLPARRRGQTLGKRAAGIAMVRQDGTPVSMRRACGRYFAYFLSGAPLGAGFICAFVRKDRMALHDLLTDTCVVTVSELPLWRRRAVNGTGIAIFAAGVIGLFLLAGPPPDPPGPVPEAETSAQSPEAGLTLLRDEVGAHLVEQEEHPLSVEDLGLEQLPLLTLPEHDPTVEVEPFGPEACDGPKLRLQALRDTGRWGYVGAAGAPCRGQVFIDCTHPAPEGRPWSER